ncbi:MAG TPA: sigma-70 family RNA polymerase sigma factor [Planctomycetota bacterium]|nr:sigma-70 family RNA polymerase sigma factor [Planctomycetota bacterium]
MPGETEILGNDRHFPPTEWELLQATPNLQSIDVLVRRYWKPLYFYVRRNRFDVETSKDIVQGFLANVISRDTFWKADPKLGRFRTFVLSALSNYIKDWSRTSTRLKRGGGHRPVSLDFSSVEAEYSPQIASEQDTPENVLNRAWARTLLDESLGEVKGSPPHLEAFRLYLDGQCYETIAEKTGMSETAAKVAVHRLRGKLRKILIGRIAETVDNQDDLQAELSEFVDLLS